MGFPSQKWLLKNHIYEYISKSRPPKSYMIQPDLRVPDPSDNTLMKLIENVGSAHTFLQKGDIFIVLTDSKDYSYDYYSGIRCPLKVVGLVQDREFCGYLYVDLYDLRNNVDFKDLTYYGQNHAKAKQAILPKRYSSEDE